MSKFSKNNSKVQNLKNKSTEVGFELQWRYMVLESLMDFCNGLQSQSPPRSSCLPRHGRFSMNVKQRHLHGCAGLLHCFFLDYLISMPKSKEVMLSLCGRVRKEFSKADWDHHIPWEDDEEQEWKSRKHFHSWWRQWDQDHHHHQHCQREPCYICDGRKHW